MCERDEREIASRGKRDARYIKVGTRQNGGKESGDARTPEAESTTAVDMLRCHCAVPAPVGCCRCPDCNIVLYCLLPRCVSPTVCALDRLSK